MSEWMKRRATAAEKFSDGVEHTEQTVDRDVPLPFPVLAQEDFVRLFLQPFARDVAREQLFAELFTVAFAGFQHLAEILVRKVVMLLLEVVAEKEKNGRLYGTTGNYLKVEIRGGDGIKEGDLLKGKVISLAPLALIVD